MAIAHWTDHLPEGWRSQLSFQETEVMFGYPWMEISIAELWSWRGEIIVRHGWSLPDPKIMNKDGKEHPIFQPWQITRIASRRSDGTERNIRFYRRGRRLKDDSWLIEQAHRAGREQ